MTFQPIHDLESLTEEQREAYYLSACENYDIPPEMHLLDFVYMDSGNGKRTLQLYAKKGATDFIRSKREISVVSTERADGPGYIAWIVKGVTPSNRMEMAVGSAAIDKLFGTALANAVMIAHTRAVRRMTLQFVGGGLLDESELPGAVSDIGRSGASLASLATLPTPPEPVIQPNPSAGRDVTPVKIEAFKNGDITPKLDQLERIEKLEQYPIIDPLIDEMPTSTESEEWNKKLSVYTAPAIGKLALGGITTGITWRVKKYVMHVFPDIKIENGKFKPTTRQWNDLIEHFEKLSNTPSGPKLLVDTIEKTILSLV